MKSLALSSVFGFAVFAMTATPSSAAVTLSGVYDPGSDANDVDASATFASGTLGVTAANTIDVATFKPLVATAFANGTGGVMSFDVTSPVADSVTSSTAFSSTPFSGYTANFGFATGNTSISTGANGTGNRVATSGTRGLVRGSNTDFHFNSLTVTGPDTGHGLTHFGATLIQRTESQTWDVSAVFSGGGTLTFTTVTFAGGDAANTRDTFFGIVAPAGQTITSVNFNSDSNFSWLDDVAFITNIPEPTTAALGFLGALFLLRRRRA